MDDSLYLPETTDGLLEFLAETYPPKCIAPDQRPEDAHRYAGKVELIRELISQREQERDEG
ncbi:hypothetical protein KAJ83_01610 [Marivibrio halodurans]|uniref:Uncharacterized protein n=1 Tax=Marivibrio halodurans TaxID=2039722 RepID=A0A8J7RZ24_9PROT|nr:hypothetical protein [Marivibrio halodurans]MBP5855689.1 hypothetical protein [Marivibrio halodurans]